MAQMMADGIYSYIVSKQFTNDTPEATAKYAYFQAVVDLRRMLADPEYAHLLFGDEACWSASPANCTCEAI